MSDTTPAGGEPERVEADTSSSGLPPWPPSGSDDTWWHEGAPARSGRPGRRSRGGSAVERAVAPRPPLAQTEDTEPVPEPAPAAEPELPVYRPPDTRRPSPRLPAIHADVPPQPTATAQPAGIAALIEFTRPDGDTADRSDSGARGDRSARTDPARGRGPKPPRNPVVGLVALLVFAFAAAFFAWDSASPIWLALGHERAGVATVANCPVHGLAERCAQFTANDKSFTTTVRLAGPASVKASDGQHLAAEMVNRSGNVAYAGDKRSLYLGWVPGVALLLLCGLGIVWATGARRLAGRRARRLAVLGSFAGPILLLVGMLAATW